MDGRAVQNDQIGPGLPHGFEVRGQADGLNIAHGRAFRFLRPLSSLAPVGPKAGGRLRVEVEQGHALAVLLARDGEGGCKRGFADAAFLGNDR